MSPIIGIVFPEQRLYDDRVKLMAYLETLFAQIPPAQSEINALWETAKTQRSSLSCGG